MQHRFLESIDDIDARQWNSLNTSGYPFTQHAFLKALEDSGSVSAKRGWQPQHLIIEDKGQLLAAMPMYLKTHSYGEYVFDWSWADAYQRHGMAYYPKLLAAIPFTPSTGPRLLTGKHETKPLIDYIGSVLPDICQQTLTTGFHLLFPWYHCQDHWKALPLAERLGCQFHWLNRDYQDFDAFLGSLASRKRKNLRKERQTINDQGIKLTWLESDQISAIHWQQFYHFYQITYAKRSGHGGYLTQDFFMDLHKTLPGQVLLVFAQNGSGETVAGALYFYDEDTLYGRYWGCRQDYDKLHFETCYYQGIEFCIAKGLQRFDAGAQGEHKLTRGFEPVITYSYHYLQHPGFMEAVERFVVEEASAIRDYQQSCKAHLPFRQDDK